MDARYSAKPPQDLRQDASSIATLLGDALSQFSKLVENEIDLAKAEAGEKFRQIGNGAAMLACGAMLAIPAVVMVLFALSAMLVNNGWSPPAAYFVSGLIAAIVAAVMVVIGMRKLEVANKPSETMRQIEKDKETIKGFAR